MKLIGCGDSWMWGCELVDPTVETLTIEEQYKQNLNDPESVFNKHYIPENKAFRHKHRYQNIIADNLGAEVIDLSRSGASNQYIERILLGFLAEEGYLQGKDTSDLLVLIGWTSPFRATFFTDNELVTSDLLPSFRDYIKDKDLYNFYEYFTKHFWSTKQVLIEYSSLVYRVQSILKALKIKYQMHQVFFDNYHFHKLEDTKLKNRLFDDKTNKANKIWDGIDSKFFVDKDNSAYTYLLDTKENDVMFASHPNVKGHKILAEYFTNHLKENVL